jgi:AGZA family xanthine/uracil permease-like MFS transporter
MKTKLENFFNLKENNTNIRTEIMAGLTTFLTMAYILAVNHNILSVTGMDSGAVFTATALASAIATFVMGFWANYPIALSAGMGLNAYFAFTVCLGDLKGVEDPWKIALAAVFTEGIVFLILSLFKVRETLVNIIPLNLKYGITVGIGLFIGFLGLQDSGIIVKDDSTLVALGSFSNPEFILCLIGILIIAVLTHYKIKGSILCGIIITWILGVIAQFAGWYVPDVSNGIYSLIPSFSLSDFVPPSVEPTFFQFNFSWIAKNLITFISITFSFLFVDIFDTVGFVIGMAEQGKFLDKKGNLPRVGRVLTSDAIGTVTGSILGSSPVTSYMESSAGVAAGGRTGLTSVATGAFFIIALFLSPIFLAIPSFATAPGLIMVSFYMIESVRKMNFTDDIADALGGFFTLIFMPLTCSIANGIMFGIIVWVILKVLTKKAKDVHPFMWAIFIFFIIRIISLI